MELNKIAAAILLAGLIAMIAGKASEILYFGGAGHHGGESHEKRGYSIEVAEGGDGAAAPAEKVLADIAPLLAGADAAAGEGYFKKACASCHNANKGEGAKIGPPLWGVVNRSVGSVSGFSYSDALKGFGGKWDYETLNKFLNKPKKFMPGTIMAFVGIGKDADRANLIAYLRSLSDAPAALPIVSAAPAAAVEAPAPAATE